MTEMFVVAHKIARNIVDDLLFIADRSVIIPAHLHRANPLGVIVSDDPDADDESWTKIPFVRWSTRIIGADIDRPHRAVAELINTIEDLLAHIFPADGGPTLPLRKPVPIINDRQKVALFQVKLAAILSADTDGTRDQRREQFIRNHRAQHDALVERLSCWQSKYKHDDELAIRDRMKRTAIY